MHMGTFIGCQFSDRFSFFQGRNYVGISAEIKGHFSQYKEDRYLCYIDLIYQR